MRCQTRHPLLVDVQCQLNAGHADSHKAQGVYWRKHWTEPVAMEHLQYHTPTAGPWTSHGVMVLSLAPSAKLIARAEYGLMTAPEFREAMANAQLLAAAPDLLDSLRLLVGMIRASASSYTSHPDFTRAEAAIAKAEGAQ